MPDIKTHCEESIRIFGQPYTHIHKWLDAFAGSPGLGGVAHRRRRHHQQGLDEVRHTWGDAAAEVAQRHIMTDLEQVGWTGVFPRNEMHCLELGLWVTQ